jgi:hypothetical protein
MSDLTVLGRRRIALVLASLGALVLPAAAHAAPYSATAPVVVSSTPSPFASCTADDPTGQPGTLWQNGEVEPSVAVDPQNPNVIAGVWQQDRWSNGGSRGTVAGVSSDGGATWQEVSALGATKCQGGPWDRASDPWVSFGPDGTLYSVSLVFSAFSWDNGVVANTSHDGGRTWSAPVDVTHDNIAGVIDDKESVTADPTRPGHAYAVWDRINIGAHATSRTPAMFSRTSDWGQTWSTPRPIYRTGRGNGTIGNVLAVLPDGTLVDVFDWVTARAVNLVSAIRSTDGGRTWTAPIVIGREPATGVVDPDTGAAVRNGGVLPDVAVDRTSGALYAVWETRAFGGIDQIVLKESLDGGLTWSAPMTHVNQTPAGLGQNGQAFTPSVAVADDGTVAVAYYDFRDNTPAPGLTTDYWLATCRSICTSSSSWSETHVGGPFDEEQAPRAGGYFLGDYEGLAPLADGGFGSLFVQAVSRAAGNPSDVFWSRVEPAP